MLQALYNKSSKRQVNHRDLPNRRRTACRTRGMEEAQCIRRPAEIETSGRGLSVWIRYGWVTICLLQLFDYDSSHTFDRAFYSCSVYSTGTAEDF